MTASSWSERPQAVVFDLDGTLVDSMPDITRALNAALGKAGLPALDQMAVRRMVGHGAGQLVRDGIKAAANGEAVARRFEDIYADYIAAYDASPCVETRLYDGAGELLHDLRARGVKLGVCTNKPLSTTRLILDALEISDLFGCVVGGRDDVPLKPAPDMLLAVLRVLCAEAGASIMVGDSAADAGAGRAAGTRVVLVEHGYGGPRLVDLGADATVASFGDLTGLLGLPRRA